MKQCSECGHILDPNQSLIDGVCEFCAEAAENKLPEENVKFVPYEGTQIKTTLSETIDKARAIVGSGPNVAYISRGASQYVRDVMAELITEIEDRDLSFDMRWKADMRAIKRWQEAHPGNELVWPDHADLCVWLLEQLDEKSGATEAAE